MTAVEEPVTTRRATFHPLRVAAVDRLTDDAVALTFDVPPALREAYRFIAGQHVNVRSVLAGDDVRRSYSICSPATGQRLRVAVKRLDGGAFSAYAHDVLRPGDTVDVMTPTGRFFTRLDPANSKHYAAIAAGSGITPVLSIVATALEVERQSRVTLVYGNRTTRSVMFLEELADLKDRYPDRFAVHHVLSREPQDVELFSGRLDPERISRFLELLLPVDTVDEWFLCGPFAMIEGARETLLGNGVRRERIHTELFHVEGEQPRESAPAAGDDGSLGDDAARVTAVLDGRSTTFEMARSGDRVLDALLRVRDDAPYACKGGVCGTCRAKLVDGEVRMERNYALEDDELESGFVLACQSHPVSDAVTLDFDQ